MAEIINLNKFRKQKKRDEARQTATENRVKHGRTKSEKQIDAAETKNMRKTTDGAKRSNPDDKKTS